MSGMTSFCDQGSGGSWVVISREYSSSNCPVDDSTGTPIRPSALRMGSLVIFR